MSIIFRRANESDREFLKAMNTETESWGDPARLETKGWTEEEFLADEILYVGKWTEEQGGMIAEEDGDNGQTTRLGAAWLRNFTSEEPGFGYLSDEYPEVAIALTPESTGKGIGRKLMTACLDLAQMLGKPGVSLCVEDGNDRAKHLYESIGFEHVRMDDSGKYFLMLYRF